MLQRAQSQRASCSVKCSEAATRDLILNVVDYYSMFVENGSAVVQLKNTVKPQKSSECPTTFHAPPPKQWAQRKHCSPP